MSPATSTSRSATADPLDPATADFYRHAMRTLAQARVPFLVGGAYAYARYTGVVRHTKDFDVFVRPEDRDRALLALSDAGYATEIPFPHWLGKAWRGDDFVDVIYGGGNGIAGVDERWLEHAVDGEVLGLAVRLCPVEEIIWSKSFIMERERYDGADIAHLLLNCARDLDWDRLLERFGSNWRVLLNHLILFGYVYPGERDAVPRRVMDDLFARLDAEGPPRPEEKKLCRGTLVSRSQYLLDVEERGFRDARLAEGAMSRRDVATWTIAAREEEKKQLEIHKG